MLKTPLILDGALHYGGRDELGKSVAQPYVETTAISAGKVEVRRSGKPVQRFSLERAPELQALLTAFSALLGGDAATLALYYRIDAQQDGARFTLTLTPQRADLARHLADVVVDGSGAEPRCFAFRQTDGDSSVMLLGPLAAIALPQPLTAPAVSALCRSAAP